jgi:hypothetical protein
MIGDGRDEYHERAYESLLENVGNDFAHRVVIDDRDHELGFAGAIQAGWDKVLETDSTHIFHFEADFTFNWPVELEPIIRTLDDYRYLTQIALLRQPVNPSEIEAGGIIQEHPESFEQVSLPDGRAWIEHRRFFTTNPSIYPRWVAECGWPQGKHSEGHFATRLFDEDPARRAAIWGRGEQWVRHIGNERAGHGY